MSQPQQDQAQEIYKSVRWYVIVRLCLLLTLAVPGLVTLFIFKGWVPETQRNTIIAIIALLSNLPFYALSRVRRTVPHYQKSLAAIWIASDIILVTVFVFINGGIESRSPILYTVPMLMAAAIFGRRMTYAIALCCGSAYVFMIFADYLNVIHSIGANDPNLRTDLPYVVHSIAFFSSIFFVIALSVDYMTSLLILRRQQADDSATKLARAQEIGRLGSWEWDIADDTIQWSDEILRIYGISRQQGALTYEGYMKLIHPDDREMQRKTIERALRKKTNFVSDHRILTPDGTLKFIHGEGRPLLDKQGNITGLTGTAHDVTDYRLLEDAKQEFVSLASHQLRTPASAVRAFLSLLRDGYGGQLNSQQSHFVQQAYESNERQLEIIEDLLSVATLEAGKLAPTREKIDLCALAKSCMPGHRQKAREHQQKLKLELLSKKIYVMADANQLCMAIDNLISNAIKYTPGKGSVTVRIRQTSRSAYIEVIDTGIGIAKQDIGLLFQKFSRLSNHNGQHISGSGLGLYLARNMVRMQHGSITVKSHPGEGTTFKIRLPLISTKPGVVASE